MYHYQIIPVISSGSTSYVMCMGSDGGNSENPPYTRGYSGYYYSRPITVSRTGIYFGAGNANGTPGNHVCLPELIYGVTDITDIGGGGGAIEYNPLVAFSSNTYRNSQGTQHTWSPYLYYKNDDRISLSYNGSGTYSGGSNNVTVTLPAGNYMISLVAGSYGSISSSITGSGNMYMTSFSLTETTTITIYTTTNSAASGFFSFIINGDI